MIAMSTRSGGVGLLAVVGHCGWAVEGSLPSERSGS